jgi:hypothetical protein
LSIEISGHHSEGIFLPVFPRTEESTINVRLAAVRRLAYEASDTGLLSPELAAGIRRVKGAKRLGVWVGNWLTVDQSVDLLGEPADSLRGKT